MSAIRFVRHGRTVLNEQRRTQGSSDSPLTPEGRRGARATAEHLGRLPLARAYLSPQGRVGRTADILLAGRPDVERTALDGLREYDYGIYDGGPDEVMLRALDPARHLPGVLSGAHPGAPGGHDGGRGPFRGPLRGAGLGLQESKECSDVGNDPSRTASPYACAA